MMSPTTATTLQAAADTVVAVMPRDALSVATDVAVLIMATGVAVLSLLAIVVLRRVDRSTRTLRRRVESSLAPVSDRARSISDNVEFITEALRTDVQALHGSVKALSDRLQQASDRMEERIEEFNALMEVVQGEAEDIFLDTAATVRGVREGAARAISGAPEEPSRDDPIASGPDALPKEPGPDGTP